MNIKSMLGMLLLSTLLILSPAKAQTSAGQIRIADDSSSGTFRSVLTDLIGVCSTDQFSIVEAKGVTGGAPGNLDALVTNKADAGFVDSDVYFVMRQSDPTYAKYKTLISLYPDPIHVLTLTQSKAKDSWFRTKDFNTLTDLRGYKVGAAGGGVFTMGLLTGQGQVGFTAVPYQHGDEVIDALNTGAISAAIFVGAAPIPNIDKLNHTHPGMYKLLPIDGNIASNLAGVYKVAKISYVGMSTAPIATLAPWATLLSRHFSTPEKNQTLKNFRNCFYKQLPSLQDNSQPVWQQVDATDHGVIDYLELN